MYITRHKKKHTNNKHSELHNGGMCDMYTYMCTVFVAVAVTEKNQKIPWKTKQMTTHKLVYCGIHVEMYKYFDDGMHSFAVPVSDFSFKIGAIANIYESSAFTSAFYTDLPIKYSHGDHNILQHPFWQSFGTSFRSVDAFLWYLSDMCVSVTC